MTSPCSQEAAIAETKSAVDVINAKITTQNYNIDRLVTSNSELVLEMREMTKTLTAHMIENQRHTDAIAHLKDGQNILFKRGRRFEDELHPKLVSDLAEAQQGLSAVTMTVQGMPERVSGLEGWQNRMRGILLVVPITCTVVSTLATVVVLILTLSGEPTTP